MIKLLFRTKNSNNPQIVEISPDKLLDSGVPIDAETGDDLEFFRYKIDIHATAYVEGGCLTDVVLDTPVENDKYMVNFSYNLVDYDNIDGED